MRFSFSRNASPAGLETRMQKVSLVASLLALGFMISGFSRGLITGHSHSFPGLSVPPLRDLISSASPSLDVALMSVGILLLGMLPAIRVLLALWLYLRSKDLRSTLISLIVLLELLLSVRLSA